MLKPRSLTMAVGMAALIALAATTWAADPPTPDAATENTAGSWGGDAYGSGAYGNVYDDTIITRVGNASIRFETNGGFDTQLWAPVTKDGGWDLDAVGSGGVGFWVRTENPNAGFQGPFLVQLHTSQNDSIAFTASTALLNDSRNTWKYYVIPLNGDDTWTVTTNGNPDTSNINWIEFHADTWGYGFEMWIDGLTFDVQYAPPTGLFAVSGNNSISLGWDVWSDPGATFDHYAIYRATSPFTSTTGMTPIATISDYNDTSHVDNTAVNGVSYYYAVTVVMTTGAETSDVEAVGPRVPRDETDLQITSMARTPRYPRYLPQYTYYEVTEPSGFGPYGFTAATGIGGGQDETTPRWPDLGDPVTYTATIRNRGTNLWSGTLGGTWTLDGSPIANPSQPVTLAPGETTTFSAIVNWDGAQHDIEFLLDVADDRAENNARRINTKSVPFLTYVDLGALEDFRDRTSPNYPQAVTDDMIDWLWRHAERMNEMFAAKGGQKHVHYGVLEVIDDRAPDPGIDRTPFAIFPFRYYNATIGDPRSPGYYHADVDIDYGLCHEMAHQLGLIDLYRLNTPASFNQVSGIEYWAHQGLMNSVHPYFSENSVRAMDYWLDTAHGYYGQYLYCMPAEVQVRFVGWDGEPLSGVSVTGYQRCERPGMGEVLTSQVKFSGTSGTGGIYPLPNVPIDPVLVPTTYAGDTLHDNPFGYVAVVGTNGLLHFRSTLNGVTQWHWLEITDVNNAYWDGQTTTAVFDYPFPSYAQPQQVPWEDMAELNAANWRGTATAAQVTVEDDTANHVVNDGSVKVTSTGPFVISMRHPHGFTADWDLSDVETIRFRGYTTSAVTFHNNSPRVRLITDGANYYEWTPSSELMNQARNQWYEFVVPIAGDATWTRTTVGTPSLASVTYVDIRMDPVNSNASIWLDGVRFDPQPGLLPGDLNCDGAVDVFDINPFVTAILDPAGYAAAYPGCAIDAADINEDGAVDVFDINPFVDLVLGQ